MPRIAYVLFAVLACVLHAATAYTAQPLRHSRVLARTSARAEVQMMPKFIKDLFPNMKKPDNPMGGLGKLFKGKKTKADDLPMEVAEDECIADAENEMEINACKEG